MTEHNALTPSAPGTTAPQRSALKTWAGRLGGIVFGVLLAWLLAEVLLRVFFFSLPPKLQLVLNSVHKTPFTDARLLPDPIWQPDTKYLTITRPVTDQEQFGSAEVRFDVSTEALWGSRAAFRTQQALVDRHVDGVAVGDSFTFCFTATDDCWVQRLGALTDRNIINLGITSTGSVSHLRVLADFGMPLEPPLVLWQWYGNDANEDFGLADLNGDTDVKSPHPPIPAPERNWLDENSAFYALLKLLLGSEDEYQASLQFHDPDYAEEGDIRLAFGRPYLWDAFDMSQPHNLDGWARSQAAFREAQQMVEGYGGTLVIVLMPTKEQVYRAMSEPLLGAEKLALLDESYQMMLDFCAAENLTCIDLLPVFAPYVAAGEQLYYTTDIHLNPRGNEVLAEHLAAWLAEHPAVFE
jgi:hypothetical protein